ncbi:MAG: NUDIX hydrolase [Verrucomicrobiales bacterium]
MKVDKVEPCVIADPDGWTTLRSDTVFSSTYVRVDEVNVRTPSQPERELSWTVVRRKSAVAVAAMTGDGKLVMVEQERVAPRRALTEFPAGQIDDVDNRFEPDVILATLQAELREEVGYEIAEDAEVVSLGYYFTSQGFTDEHIYLFFVSKVVPLSTGNAPDASESILGTRLIEPATLKQMVASNEVNDSLTLALYARLTARSILF